MTAKDELLILKRQLLGLHKQTGMMIRAVERVLGALAKEAPPAEEQEYREEIRAVVESLNGICKRNFSAETRETALLISRRLAEGYSVEDLKRVIRACNDAWGGDPKMRMYLRPSTLFGEQFESYYQAAEPEDRGLHALEERLKQIRREGV